MSLFRTLVGRRLSRVLALASTLAIGTLALGAGSAFAYGKADQPLAQIEFSGNCNNPGFFLCQPPPAGFGLGGAWYWIEIDANGTGDIAGSGCMHVRGLFGGAEKLQGEISWYASTGVPAGAEGFVVDPNNQYYVVSIPNGEIVAFPMTVGHYSWHPVPGVALEIQIAP